jgi:hypothetical protein
MKIIEERLSGYARAWRDNDAQALEAFWDKADERPFYKPEEFDEVMSGWDAVRKYWQHNEQFHERVDLNFADIQTKPLGDDWVMAVFRMRWDILFSADARLPDGSPFQWRGQAMGGDDHVVTLWRQRVRTWYLCTWIEVPMAPISYIANLYLKNLSPGFPRKTDPDN